MADYTGNALLIDGDTLHGVSCSSQRDVFSEDASFSFASWKFSDGAPAPQGEGAAAASAEGEPVAAGGEAEAHETESTAPAQASSRAEAFASAARELDIKDGAPLALPPDLLVTRVVTLPATDSESIAQMVRLEMEKFAPVSDSDLEVDYETITATEDSTRVFAVAVPIATLDGIAADLEASGLAVTRIDSSMLCEWMSLQARLEEPRQGDGDADEDGGAPGQEGEDRPRQLVAVFALPSGRFDFVAADGQGLVFARTLGTPASASDLAREVTLSLLDLAAERRDFSPARFLLVAHEGLAPEFADAIAGAADADIDRIPESELRPYVRCALEREEQEGCIDIVPAAWREDEMASQRRRNFIAGAIAAVAVWAVIFATLLAIPRMIKRQTAAVRDEIKAVMPRYSEVANLRSRVRLIQSYDDRSRSAIEVLRHLCGAMPEGMVFSSFSYDNTDDGSRGRNVPGGVKVNGDAPDQPGILQFKNALDEAGLFAPARLKGPMLDNQRSRYKFELDWRFAEDGSWQ